MKDVRILLFDIENAPLTGFTWGKYEQNVIAVIQDWYLLSFAYKWLGKREVHTVALPDFALYKKDKRDDYELTKKLWEIIDQADLIVAHNGDAFDLKKANARFVAHGLTPPKPYKSIDTLKIARQQFKFTSNKLDDLGKTLGVGRKLVHTGFDLWQRCMDGDPKAWKLMRAYNAQDVKLLERVYLKLRPWGKHPNINDITRKPHACPKCQSTILQKRGFRYTRTSEIQQYACLSCGAWSLGTPQKLSIRPELR